MCEITTEIRPCSRCWEECGPACPCSCHTDDGLTAPLPRADPLPEAAFAHGLGGLVSLGLVAIQENEQKLYLTERSAPYLTGPLSRRVRTRVDPWLVSGDVEAP